MTHANEAADATAHDITVYRYGLREPRNWDADCDGEIGRMTALWNRLVEIEHGHRAAVTALTADVPAVVAAQHDADAIRNGLAQARAERAAARKAARGNVDAPGLDARIADLASRLRAINMTLSTARRSARAARADQLRALNDARKEQVKIARQQSGLYWGNYNAVINSYEVARSAAMKRGAALQFRRRTGEGRLVNQIIGGMTADDLHSCQKSQLAIFGPRVGHAELRATVYTSDRKPRYVRWPINLDRPLPDDARIQEATITRRRRAHKWRWSVSFLLRVPAALPSATSDGRACGIDVGWRVCADGLRVATLVDELGAREHLILPAGTISRLRHAETLVSERAQYLAALLPELRRVDWARAPSPLGSLAQSVQRQPNPDQLHDLVLAWRRQQPDWEPSILAQASEWLSRDRILADYQAGAAARARNQRADIYRCAAKRWAQAYGLIGIEKLDLAAMLARETPDGEAQDVRRWHARAAAPAELLTAIRRAAHKTGARFHEHAGKSTWACAECGTVHAPADPRELIHACGGCGAIWDQDVNAARNLLAAARASAPVAADGGAALAWEKSQQDNGLSP